MKQILFKISAATLFLAGTLNIPVQAKGVSGAIFTTTMDGSLVNGNQFSSKCDVYLDGGPGPNAPAKAAGLPDGDYYFQVTDPSGSELLSTDPVSNRRFTVTGGVISGHSGTHPTGVDQDHGAVTVGLAGPGCPADFLNTPNNGGVYKVWATPVADFVGNPAEVDNPCGGGCFHGFVASKSKTDNFKVLSPPSTGTFCLTLGKLFRELGGNEVPVENWQLLLTDPLGPTNPYYTAADGLTEPICGLAANQTYTVSEAPQEYEGLETQIFGLLVKKDSGEFMFYPRAPGDVNYMFSWDESQPEPVIIYINVHAGSDQ